MATKVEQVSSVEPRRTSMSTSSAVSPINPKVSKFGAKSGFVIPKNKLSGSMVPIFRGGGKVEASDTAEEEIKQVQRKTKWSIDPTQDAAVRRGRALAYQTRVEQITRQMKYGALESGDDHGSQSPTGIPNQDSSNHQIDNELQTFELLELERREAIGEILRLNPSYKAPPDYKPLLKEARVPIPLKAYPGYNFIGLILGPESNTQKRLEEETGAKIQVHGTKMEITQADGDEAQVSYEELYVHVSADTFEKVDAAVALIELLVTPVSVNSVAVSTTLTSITGDNVNVLDPSHGSTTSYMIPTVNQGAVQPMVRIAQSGPPRVQFQPYRGPWLQLGPPQAPMRPPSGFIPPPSNSIRFHTSPINLFNPPPFFGGRPPAPTGFGLVPRNPSLGQQPPMQALQRPYMPETRPLNQAIPSQNHPMLGQQTSPTYPSLLARPSSSIQVAFSSSQPMPIGPSQPSRPPMPQPVPTTPSGSPSNWPLRSAPPVSPSPIRPANMMQMGPPSVRPQGPHSAVQQSATFGSVAPQSNMTTNVVSRPLAMNSGPLPAFPPRPSTPQLPTTPPVNHSAAFPYAPPLVGVRPAPPLTSPSISAPVMVSISIGPSPGQTLLPSPAPRPLHIPASVPGPTQAPLQAFSQAPVLVNTPPPVQSSLSMAPVQPIMARPQLPIPSPNPGQPSVPVPPQVQSASPPSFSPIKPPMTSSVSVQPIAAPKPKHPSSGDFTFQPLRTQVVPRPSNQTVAQTTAMPPLPAIQPPSAPQAPSFRPALNNSAPQMGMPGFQRPQASSQMGQPQAPAPPPSPGSLVHFPSNPRPPPGLPSFPNTHPSTPANPTHQMGPPSFLSGPRGPNLPGSLPIRPGNLQLLHHNQLPPTNRPGGLMMPNQQLGNSLGYASGKPTHRPSGANQIYDPFSPTSISGHPQQGDDPAKARKQETDPEYEDLMASVGVK
ncbi:RNA-binding KH domain-containing protein isoform X2 [Tasmannia lanceolata]|uniref:RNA-binding KH domain-containing protein isoform X2 n=1 Tax=Tasmannia lanceolata TaxID=3420 RepID=UPI004062AE01